MQILVQFDTVVSNFKGHGVVIASKANYAFILYGLYDIDKTEAMAIVLPHVVLFHGVVEAKIRKNVIYNNFLDTVIGLPAIFLWC